MMSASSPMPSASSWAALRYPAFRWFYVSMIISLSGSAMQLAAVNWHVWNITHSELALGFVGLVRIGPIIVLSLLGGVVADAADRRKLQIATQTLMLIFASILGFMTLTNNAALWLIYLMTAAISGMTAFDNPARNAMAANLVPTHEIANASRLTVLMFQLTSVIGPSLAGLVLGAVGPGLAYLINALSFVPVVVVLIWLRKVPMQRTSTTKREISFQALFEGLRFVLGKPLLWSTMLVDFFATLLASATVLLPVYATEILKVGATGYGILSAAPAAGSTLGAILMAQYGGRIVRQGMVMLGAVALFGAATVIFGLSNVFLLSLAALAVTGFADAVSTGIRAPLRQVLTPDHLRGRMQSVNMIFVMGGPQLGEFEAGVVAHLFGPVASVVTGGVATVILVGLIAYSVPLLTGYRTTTEAATSP